jgi:5'-nucleotidase
MGREHYWFTVTPIESVDEGSDRWAVRNGWTSITPMILDLTDTVYLLERLNKER